MKKILLIYLPFCTPASPPYSLTAMHGFLSNNCENNVEILDLNILFHKLKFPQDQQYYQSKDWQDYNNKTKDYNSRTMKVYSENNKKVRNNQKPEFFDELFKEITKRSPDIVALSFVYSSQAFYGHALLEELKQNDETKHIKRVIGGPSTNKKLIQLADHHFKNEVEFLNFIKEKEVSHEELNITGHPDFSTLNLKEYFTPEPVIPLKTSTTCYYKQCTFCAHYNKVPYFEYPIEQIEKTITTSSAKHFFFIDDMVPAKRLIKIAKMIKPLNIKWGCQLKPTKHFDSETLKELKESGLVFVLWGFESGSQRILDLMKKGTIIEEVKKVLEDSHNAGIINITYTMFGFPTETKEEFLQTIKFLQDNDKYIDMVFPSTFGLQEGTPIYKDPEAYGITEVNEKERTILDAKITYKVSSGMSNEEAAQLRRNYKKTIDKINKFPKTMNFFREHMFFVE